MMSSFVAMPREGQLQQLYHIFGYLKLHHNARLVLDSTYPDIDTELFKKRDWKEFYGDAKEALPKDAPTLFGHELIIRSFVNADFAGDTISRKSWTVFIMMLHMAPVYWLSKKQTCIETSSFGSKFCAMKQCCEYI